MKTTILKGVIALFLITTMQQVTAAIPLSERNALIALYNATNGSGWKTHTGWLGAPGTECSWQGVVCRDNSIIRILLRQNSLAGNIPPELGQLSKLIFLDLHNNQLTGNIPPELGQLSQLTHLGLAHNQLTGHIPLKELGQLSQLKKLGLSYNDLTGDIPLEFFQQLTNLVAIGLTSNCLTVPDTIPVNKVRADGQRTNCSTPSLAISTIERNTLISLYHSTNGNNWKNKSGWLGSPGTECHWKGIECAGNAITKVNLSENQLAGNIPSGLGQLSQLTELILYGNQLAGNIPPELGQLSNLSILGLATNQLTGTIPSALGQLSQLKELFLHENQLMGTIPFNLGQLSQLTWLSLSTNQLTGNIIPQLGNLSELRDLYLQENNLTGNIPAELGQLFKLESLNLENNCLTTNGSTPASFLDSINTTLWRNQDTNCSTPLPLQQQAVSLYDDKTGMLIIKDVAVNGANYSAELKDQGGFQFLLTKTTLLSKSVHNTPANYSADTGLVNIPSVFALGRLYTVQLKNNGGGVFSLTKAE